MARVIDSIREALDRAYTLHGTATERREALRALLRDNPQEKDARHDESPTTRDTRP